MKVCRPTEYSRLTLSTQAMHLPPSFEASPAVPLPQLTKSLKGITAKRANAMLALGDRGAPAIQGSRPTTGQQPYVPTRPDLLGRGAIRSMLRPRVAASSKYPESGMLHWTQMR